METVSCIFGKRGIIVLCYVVDLFLFATDERAADEIKAGLSTQDSLKDLKKPAKILDIDMRWKRDGLMLMQPTLVMKKLFNYAEIQDAKPVGSSVDSATMKSSEKAEAVDTFQHQKYRKMIDSFMFLETGTTPDLAVAASMISSHLNNPTATHMTSAKRTIRYLKESSCYVINLQWKRNTPLAAYVDASRMNAIGSIRRSRSGALFMNGHAVVGTPTSLLKTVSWSSTEAE